MRSCTHDAVAAAAMLLSLMLPRVTGWARRYHRALRRASVAATSARRDAVETRGCCRTNVAPLMRITPIVYGTYGY